MRVAYLGPAGTFSDEAIDRCSWLDAAERVAHPTLTDVYEAALEGRADAALMPIENSIEGAVGTTLDLLVHRPGLLIRREISMQIDQHLMARPGTRVADIERVVSHPQALGQCAAFTRSRIAQARLEPVHSTADAARIAAHEVGVAAIASRAAAARYGLEIVAASIQDADVNETRFVVLAERDEDPSGADRTSIALSLPADRPGGLYEVLGAFAARDINLSKVESRPTKRALGRYFFFIDFEGHRTEQADALREVADRSERFLVLGSYPRADAGRPTRVTT